MVVYGFDCCGVSSLIYRFSGNTFTRATMATIGVDFRIERTVVDGDLIRTVIWDSRKCFTAECCSILNESLSAIPLAILQCLYVLLIPRHIPKNSIKMHIIQCMFSLF